MILHLSEEKWVHAYLVQCTMSYSTGSPIRQMKTLIQWKIQQ